MLRLDLGAIFWSSTLLVILTFFKLLSDCMDWRPFYLRTTLDVSFFDLYFILALTFSFPESVPVDAFSGFPLSLLASVIDLIDLFDLFESSEHLLFVSWCYILSLEHSTGAKGGSGFLSFWVLHACWINFFKSAALFLPRMPVCCILTNLFDILIYWYTAHS